MTPAAFVRWFGEQRASAILRTAHVDAVQPAMQAAVDGGFRIVEFTLNTPGALAAIRAFASREELVVGAGTVMTVDEARAAVDAGARFLVSPIVDEAVIDEAARLGVACMPGTQTPTEMVRAHRAGASLIKLFPAPASGPAYLRAVMGPLPELPVVPTSGVDGDNAAEWLAAGAHAVGFVQPLFEPADMANGAFDRIRERAARLLAAVRPPSEQA